MTHYIICCRLNDISKVLMRPEMHIYDYFKGQREENTIDGTHKKINRDLARISSLGMVP